MSHVINRRIAAALISALASLTGAAAAAQAQQLQSESFVSAFGSGTSCSPTAPCASLATALDGTTDGGVVFVQGPFRLETLNLQKDVSVVATGNVSVLTAGVRIPAGGNALIQGVYFNGATFNFGVTVEGPGKVTFRNCVVSGYGEDAVTLSGSGGGRVVFDNVVIKGNRVGLSVEGQGNVVFIQKSLIDANLNFAVRVNGAANTVVISDSTLSGSGMVDLSLVNGGRAISYKSNVIRTGTPTQSVPEN